MKTRKKEMDARPARRRTFPLLRGEPTWSATLREGFGFDVWNMKDMLGEQGVDPSQSR